MKKSLCIAVGLIALTMKAHAGLFGYDGYEDCVLGEAKKLSDAKLLSTARAYCRSEFPKPTPPKSCRLLYADGSFQSFIPTALNWSDYHGIEIGSSTDTPTNITVYISKQKNMGAITMIIEKHIESFDSLCGR